MRLRVIYVVQLGASLPPKTNYKKSQIMKRLLLAAFAVGFIGCAEQYAPPSATTGYTYSRYATTAEVWGYRNPAYRNWTTAQLQPRRLELYGVFPLTRTRQGAPGRTSSQPHRATPACARRNQGNGS